MQPQIDRRKQMIRLIHVAKRDRALADDVYRGILERMTGKSSCAGMTESELDKVLKALKASGFRVKRAPAKKPRHAGAGKPRDGQAALITALWIDLWQLGAIADKSDVALDAFVKRQSGIDKLAWLPPRKAHSVIEALKSWCARYGFALPQDLNDDGLTAKRELCRAIYRRLVAADAKFDDRYGLIMSRMGEFDPDGLTWLADEMGKDLRLIMNGASLCERSEA